MIFTHLKLLWYLFWFYDTLWDIKDEYFAVYCCKLILLYKPSVSSSPWKPEIKTEVIYAADGNISLLSSIIFCFLPLLSTRCSQFLSLVIGCFFLKFVAYNQTVEACGVRACCVCVFKCCSDAQKEQRRRLAEDLKLSEMEGTRWIKTDER